MHSDFFLVILTVSLSFFFYLFIIADARRPVDPPPVLQIEIRDSNGNVVTHESKNNFIVHATLLSLNEYGDSSPIFSPENSPISDDSITYSSCTPAQSRLAGTNVASLTFVRNPSPGRFLFIFNDLSIRQEGRYRISFSMYEVLSEQGVVKFRSQVLSNIITAYSPKNFPGLVTSSDLIKEIALQGHKVRVRKESTLNRRRKKNVPSKGSLMHSRHIRHSSPIADSSSSATSTPVSVATNLHPLFLQQPSNAAGEQQLPYDGFCRQGNPGLCQYSVPNNLGISYYNNDATTVSQTLANNNNDVNQATIHNNNSNAAAYPAVSNLNYLFIPTNSSNATPPASNNNTSSQSLHHHHHHHHPPPQAQQTYMLPSLMVQNEQW